MGVCGAGGDDGEVLWGSGRDCVVRGKLGDPQGQANGIAKVLRDGSWYVYARYTRVSNRYRDFPDDRYFNDGLRVAREKK